LTGEIGMNESATDPVELPSNTSASIPIDKSALDFSCPFCTPRDSAQPLLSLKPCHVAAGRLWGTAILVFCVDTAQALLLPDVSLLYPGVRDQNSVANVGESRGRTLSCQRIQGTMRMCLFREQQRPGRLVEFRSTAVHNCNQLQAPTCCNTDCMLWKFN
jgi:hypothetical protein